MSTEKHKRDSLLGREKARLDTLKSQRPFGVEKNTYLMAGSIQKLSCEAFQSGCIWAMGVREIVEQVQAIYVASITGSMDAWSWLLQSAV